MQAKRSVIWTKRRLIMNMPEYDTTSVNKYKTLITKVLIVYRGSNSSRLYGSEGETKLISLLSHHTKSRKTCQR